MNLKKNRKKMTMCTCCIIKTRDISLLVGRIIVLNSTCNIFFIMFFFKCSQHVSSCGISKRFVLSLKGPVKIDR